MKTHYPDPSWSEKDRNGHEHSFSGNELPTLKIIIAGHHWCEECGESHEHNIYACVECGAKVEPRFTTKRPEAKKKSGRKKTYADEVAEKISLAQETVEKLAGVSVNVKPGKLMISEISIEAQRDDVEVSSFSSSGAKQYIGGVPRYTLSINDGEYEFNLTEIEIQVASQAAKRGRKGMLDFADTILRDRGVIE